MVTFAGELLGQAELLLQMGVHPSDIIVGYKKAAELALRELEGIVVERLENPRDKVALARALKPVIASKQSGNEDFLAGASVLGERRREGAYRGEQLEGAFLNTSPLLLLSFPSFLARPHPPPPPPSPPQASLPTRSSL